MDTKKGKSKKQRGQNAHHNHGYRPAPPQSIPKPKEPGNTHDIGANETQHGSNDSQAEVTNVKWKLDTWQIWFDGIVAVTAVFGVLGLLNSSWLTRNDMRATHRAWIEFRVSDQVRNVALDDLFELWFPVQLFNPGNSPARDIRIDSALEVLATMQTPQFKYGTGYSHTTAPLFPNAPRSDDIVIARLNPDGSRERITPEMRRGLEAGELYIAVHARARYIDDFGPHWTQMCFWKQFIKTGTEQFNAKSCVAYNQVGDGN